MTIWKIDINSQWRVNFVAFLCQKFLFACFEIPSLVVGTAVEKYEPNSIPREAVSNLHNFLLCINKTIIRNTKHSLDKRYGVMETKPKASWREMDMYFHLGVARIVGPIQCAALTGIMSFQFIVRVYVQKKKQQQPKWRKQDLCSERLIVPVRYEMFWWKTQIHAYITRVELHERSSTLLRECWFHSNEYDFFLIFQWGCTLHTERWNL